MKHIQQIILCLSLLITSGMQAQLPEGRTKATVIADALAQLPADTPHKYNQIIADLVSTGEEGLLDLIGRMNPPGNQSNETIDYAISGWTHFVANDNAARNVAAGTYEKALARPLDKEVKAFLIRQLRTIGTDDNVEALSAFLTDEYLSDPAAQALVSIGTENASNALQAAPATASYLSQLDRLNGTASKPSRKEAEKLLATGKKLDEQHIRIAATKVLLEEPSVKKEDILKNAIKDGNITYLSGVLNLYPFENDKKSSELIQSTLASTKSPEVQTALVYWSAKHDKKASIPQITALVNSPVGLVQKAAVLSLAKLGGEEALITLASLLKSNNDETVTLAKEALSTYNGDISYTLASVFEDCGDTGKKAILELISNRKMECQYNLVYNQMFGNNKIIKSAAAHTLKDVSTNENLPDLFTLLEQADASDVPAIQQAINAALDYLPAEEQLDMVTQRMKNSPNKHFYYTALANSESQEAINIITKAYATSTGVEKEAAFDALAHWKSFHVIYPLLDIARNRQVLSNIFIYVRQCSLPKPTSKKTTYYASLAIPDNTRQCCLSHPTWMKQFSKNQLLWPQ